MIHLDETGEPAFALCSIQIEAAMCRALCGEYRGRQTAGA
jgi:hypothetical protein